MDNHKWLIKQMERAHKDGRYQDRDNYAKMAGVDVVKHFYLEG